MERTHPEPGTHTDKVAENRASAGRRGARSRLLKLRRLSWARRGLLIEAVFWLAIAKLALLVVPFPKLARRMGTFVPPVPAPTGNASNEHADMAREVGWAVTRAARHAPFRAVCLPQAMAARLMLHRRGISSVLHFGATTGGQKPLEAHAWLDAAGVEVTGYPVARQFAEIACFV